MEKTVTSFDWEAAEDSCSERDAAVLTLNKLILVYLEQEEKICLSDKVKHIKIVWQTIYIMTASECYLGYFVGFQWID